MVRKVRYFWRQAPLLSPHHPPAATPTPPTTHPPPSGTDAHLIHRLLTKNATDRLGGSKHKPATAGALAVKKHPFFRGVDWPAIVQWQPKTAAAAVDVEAVSDAGLERWEDADCTVAAARAATDTRGLGVEGERSQGWPFASTPIGWGSDVSPNPQALSPQPRS